MSYNQHKHRDFHGRKLFTPEEAAEKILNDGSDDSNSDQENEPAG